MASETESFGKKLGRGTQDQSNLDANISPDDSSGQFNFSFSSSIEVRGRITIRRLYYLPETFVIDHPVRGEIDSNYYKIDGGHDTSSTEVALQLNF